jgi:predicted amidohydrolase YtcJ
MITRLLEMMDESEFPMDMTISTIRDTDEIRTGHSIPDSWEEATLDCDTRNSGPSVRFEKFFLDGSIGSRTASFSADYTDSSRVSPLFTRVSLRDRVENSMQEGVVPMLHCIGDRSINLAVEVLEELSCIYRLEHAEAINSKILDRMTIGKGSICMQPNFIHKWGRKSGLYENALGADGSKLDPFKTVSVSGIDLSFGTDMMPPDPLFALNGALHHPRRSECLDMSTSIKCFTKNSAKTSMVPQNSEIIEGKRPDMIIIDEKFEKVLITLKKGIPVFDRNRILM